MKLDPTPDRALRARATSDIATFRDVWPTLAAPGAGAHHIFQTADFLAVWLDTIGVARGVKPHFVRIEDATGAPLLLLALGIERRRGARVLTFLDGGICDYNAPVVFPGALCRGASDSHALWRLIAVTAPAHDAAVLDKMPLSVGSVANPLYPLASYPTAPSGYAVPLNADWRSFEATRLHRAKDSRRKRRGLAREGPLQFIVARSAEQAQALLREIMRMKTRRYLELNGEDGFDRPGYRSYFPTLTERLFHTGCVHVSALCVGERIVAGHWGLVANKRFYCLVLAHEDCAFARLSPGRLLVEDLIHWSFAHGIESFDLGYGDAPWKRLVAAERLPLSHAALPATAFGWAYVEGRRLNQRFRPDPRSHDDFAH